MKAININNIKVLSLVCLAIAILIASCTPIKLPPKSYVLVNKIQCKVKADSVSQLTLEILNELNLLRTNPKEYANIIAFETSMTEDDRETIRFLRSAKALKPLKISNCLSMAAMSHVNDQGKTMNIGHEGTDGSSLGERIRRFADNLYYSGENISYGYNDPRKIIIQLVVDSGIPDKGHRKNMFNENYKTVGIAVGEHKKWEYMCVFDFTSTESELSN